MLIYWIFLGFAALMALLEQGNEKANQRINFLWIVFTIALALFIGGRWKTGGDWGNYYTNLQPFYWLTVGQASSGTKDIGYTLLSLFAAQFPTGIVVITMFSGIVMAVALMLFSLSQPRPWLCMTVAFPYLVVVCGMGYIRQGIAISFIMIGMLALSREKVGRYTIWVAIGALFHATALALIPLGGIASRRNRLVVAAIVAGVTILAFRTLIADRTDTLVSAYVEAEAESSGALIRAFMGAVPGALYLIFRRQFALQGSDRIAWTALSAAAVAAVPAVLLFQSSTVVDRLGLYLLPVQCFVYARLPDAFAKTQQQRQLYAVGSILLYLVVFFTFINYGDHAYSWFPYRFYLFEDGICLECSGSDRTY
ncbi:EpsG family protein [Sphingomonas jatrophae]|uniref:EpsG family protein n=1 Tax=Sphingomonas jatrophae TaxID=1166337 RepID=A0A1I6L6W5_9SPHN|nr:EpsG family protein [Sphingomonas jatrophae]SFR98978.1 EpsG family protein [Sphingomonas jatrophae]